MLKILSISPGYFPAIKFGGVVTAVHGLNKALVEAGCSVTCFSSTCSLDETQSWTMPIMVDGVEVWYFDYIKWLEGPNHWQCSVALWKALNSQVPKFDIVHINCIWNFPSSAAAYVCRKLNKPYVITLHGMLYPAVIKNGWIYKYPYWGLITRHDIKHAASVHFTTTDEMEKCQSICGPINRQCVIYNGVDTDDFKALPPPAYLREKYPELKNKKVILILGRINWKKGFDILIPAFSQYYTKDKRVHLLIVGGDEGGYKKTVIDQVNRAKLSYVDHTVTDKRDKATVSPCITFAGMLTGYEKHAAYTGSDVFVLPSYSENFGLVVAEAMFCNCPVVISDQVGISKEIKEHQAGEIVTTTGSDVLRGLQKVLEDPEYALNLANNGKNMVQSLFDQKSIARQMCKVFNECL